MEPVTWNKKYWDIINNLFWHPEYLGLDSISLKGREKQNGFVLIPIAEISNSDGPLYSRSIKADKILAHLERQEEILNHFFNLTFAIVGDAVISRLFCKPFSIEDNGPFESLGREINSRFGWGQNKNATQQDGFFVSKNSAIGIELKLGASSSPEQIAKYLALMVLEEKKTGAKNDLGLIFIVPESSIASLKTNTGLSDSKIPSDFLRSINQGKFNSTLKKIYGEHREQIERAVAKIKITILTWTNFRNSIMEIERELDPSMPGEQTLYRLLSGFRAQLEAHEKTGIEPRLDRFTWTARDVEIVKNQSGD